MEIIRSKEEWEEYTNRLRHPGRGPRTITHGSPEKYPCGVLPEWNSDDNGPDYYTFEFIYVEDALELIKVQKEIYDKEPEKALEE